MTPKQVTTIDVKELKEIELRCECGTSLRLPLPLKNELPLEQKCPGCPRSWWMQGSDVRTRIEALLRAVGVWAGFDQKVLSLSFVLTEGLQK